MALIRDALSVLPAKPAVLLAPVIVVLVLSYYYWDLHRKCDDIRRYRAALSEQLRAVGTGNRFRLADFTDFAWDKVRIAAIEAGMKTVDCPLGWNWADGERDALIASGQLTAMVFGLEGRIVNYIELRSDEVALKELEAQLTAQSAVFAVAPGAPGGYRLTRVAPD